MKAPDNLTDWLPFFLSAHEGQLAVEWGYAGRERFSEPFFHDTLQRLMARPFNRAFRRQTPLSLLPEQAISHPGLPLRGLIFHMSRCGSTLVSQALAALSDTVVLSEPEPVGTLLEWLVSGLLPAEDGTELLRGLLSALGRPRRPGDLSLFMKTECWHICHIDRMLGAFPGMPWVFIYRDPLEVLVSQARMPSLYMVPGSMVHHGLLAPAQLLTRPLEHAAWMLENILKAATQAMAQHPGGLLVNYEELPDAIETRLAGHFGLEFDEADLDALRAVSALNAKQPHQAFLSDSAEKRASANAGLRAATERWLAEPYAELERLRREIPTSEGL